MVSKHRIVLALAFAAAVCCGSSAFGQVGGGPPLDIPLSIAVEASGDLVVIDQGLVAVVRVDPVTGDRTIVSDVGTGAGPASTVDPVVTFGFSDLTSNFDASSLLFTASDQLDTLGDVTRLDAAGNAVDQALFDGAVLSGFFSLEMTIAVNPTQPPSFLLDGDNGLLTITDADNDTISGPVSGVWVYNGSANFIGTITGVTITSDDGQFNGPDGSSASIHDLAGALEGNMFTLAYGAWFTDEVGDFQGFSDVSTFASGGMVPEPPKSSQQVNGRLEAGEAREDKFAVIAAVAWAGAANALDPVLTFGYSDLTSNFDASSLLFMASDQLDTFGDVTRLDAAGNAVDHGLFDGAALSGFFSLEMTIAVNPTQPPSFLLDCDNGLLTITDADNDTISGTVSGVWLYNGSANFVGTIAGLTITSDDGEFNGIDGSSASIHDLAGALEGNMMTLAYGAWFTDDVGDFQGFSDVTTFVAGAMESGSEPAQACCLPDGSCVMILEVDCLAMGGVPQGPGTTCTTVEACCFPDGTCAMVDLICCDDLGGIAQGAGTACTTSQACCFPDDTCAMTDPLCCDDLGGTVVAGACGGMQACCTPSGACYMADATCCTANGDTPQGAGTVCLGDGDSDGIDDACEDTEACCLPDGSCVMLMGYDCLAMGGIPQGNGTLCTVTEACCFPDDTCANVDPLCCGDLGGTAQGAGTACGGRQACCTDVGACYMADEACCTANGDTPKGAGSVCLGDSNGDGADDACVPPVPEACCLPDGSCVMILEVDCVAMGGVPQGPGTTCTTTQACCFPDDTCAMVDPLCCDDLGGTVVAGTCGGMQACCVDTGACYMADETCCTANGDTPKGSGSVCLGDADANGVDDACEEPGVIPAVSTWGLGILALVLLVGAKVYFNRRRAMQV